VTSPVNYPDWQAIVIAEGTTMFGNAGSFGDFGPLTLGPDAATPSCHRVHGKRNGQLRSQVRLLCPRNPGVYGMVDESGDLIYVGKAKSLRVRLLSYFRPRSRARKATRILGQTVTLVWEPCPSEFAALLRELELIRRWRPRWNVEGQPLRRQAAFVCVGRGPAPYVFLTRQPPANALATFGPISAGSRAVAAVCRMNDLFQLRDCPRSQEMIFPDQGGLFTLERAPGCLRFEIGTCLGPCTGTCGQQVYSGRVKAVRSFLAGTGAGPLEGLAKAMAAAAQAQQFERAAALRDRLESLTWLGSRLERLRNARARMSFVYPVTGKAGPTLWYLVHAGRTIKCLHEPRDSIGASLARESIHAVLRSPSASLLESHEHVDGMMLVMAWFRKYPKELSKTLTTDQALAKCHPTSRSRN
jgi:excinuclease ABC subunit C